MRNQNNYRPLCERDKIQNGVDYNKFRKDRNDSRKPARRRGQSSVADPKGFVKVTIQDLKIPRSCLVAKQPISDNFKTNIKKVRSSVCMRTRNWNAPNACMGQTLFMFDPILNPCHHDPNSNQWQASRRIKSRSRSRNTLLKTTKKTHTKSHEDQQPCWR